MLAPMMPFSAEVKFVTCVFMTLTEEFSRLIFAPRGRRAEAPKPIAALMLVSAAAALVPLVRLLAFSARPVADSVPMVVAIVLWLLASLRKIDVALPVKTDEPL